MVFFKRLQEYLRWMGILLWDSKSVSNAFSSALNCIFSIIFITFIVSMLWFVVSTAQSLSDYTESFFFVSSACMLTAWYSALFWKKNEYATLFSDLDIIVEKSI